MNCATNEVLVERHCRTKGTRRHRHPDGDQKQLKAFLAANPAPPERVLRPDSDPVTMLIVRLFRLLDASPGFIAAAVDGMRTRKDIEDIEKRYKKVTRHLPDDDRNFLKNSIYIKRAVMAILIRAKRTSQPMQPQ